MRIFMRHDRASESCKGLCSVTHHGPGLLQPLRHDERGTGTSNCPNRGHQPVHLRIPFTHTDTEPPPLPLIVTCAIQRIAGAEARAVLHWHTGPLTAANDIGLSVPVNPANVAFAKSRTLLGRPPHERVLLETGSPPHAWRADPAHQQACRTSPMAPSVYEGDTRIRVRHDPHASAASSHSAGLCFAHGFFAPRAGTRARTRCRVCLSHWSPDEGVTRRWQASYRRPLPAHPELALPESSASSPRRRSRRPGKWHRAKSARSLPAVGLPAAMSVESRGRCGAVLAVGHGRYPDALRIT